MHDLHKANLRLGLISKLTGHVLPTTISAPAKTPELLLREARREEQGGHLVAVWAEGHKEQPIFVSGGCTGIAACSHLPKTSVLGNNRYRGLDQLEEFLGSAT